MADTPNYHINLWPEPPGSPSTYLCLVPECASTAATEAAMRAHATAVHGLAPRPTPIAASAPMFATLLHESVTMAGPTYYRTEAEDGTEVYNCLYCADQGVEHHTGDLALLRMHMEQRHDGRMQEAPEDEVSPYATPEEGPPGQTGDHPDHPHGEPPGQTGQHPEHPHGTPPGQVEEPEPTHPIVEPPAAPEKA